MDETILNAPIYKGDMHYDSDVFADTCKEVFMMVEYGFNFPYSSIGDISGNVRFLIWVPWGLMAQKKACSILVWRVELQWHCWISCHLVGKVEIVTKVAVTKHVSLISFSGVRLYFMGLMANSY